MGGQTDAVELISQLIDTLSSQLEPPNLSHELKKTHRQKQNSFAREILGTNICLQLLDEEGPVCDSVRAYIMSSGDMTRATKFSELHAKMKTCVADGGVRAKVLILLHMVARDRKRSGNPQGGWWPGNNGSLSILPDGAGSSRDLRGEGALTVVQGSSQQKQEIGNGVRGIQVCMIHKPCENTLDLTFFASCNRAVYHYYHTRTTVVCTIDLGVTTVICSVDQAAQIHEVQEHVVWCSFLIHVLDLLLK